MVDNRPNKKKKSFTREKSLLTDIFSFHAVAIIYAFSSEKRYFSLKKQILPACHVFNNQCQN
jgi:hypothetical protein